MGIVPCAPITIVITVIFLVHSYFCSLARSSHSSVFSFSFTFFLWSAGTTKSTIRKILFFFFHFLSRLARDLFLSENFSFVWSNFNFLHKSQEDHLPIHSCLIFNSFGANLLHLLVIWLIVLSLSPHRLRLLFWCVLSVFSLRYSVFLSLFFVVIRKDSVSFFKLPYDISFVCHLKYLYSCFSNLFCFLGCYYVDPCVVCSVSGYCNQFLFALFKSSSSRLIDVSTLSSILANPFSFFVYHY